MSNTLYELKENYKKLYEMGDTEIDADAWADTLESINDVIEDKADGYATVIRQIKADNEFIKTEEERLAKRRKVNENKIKSLQQALINAMLETDKPKFKTQLNSFSVSQRSSVEITDENEIPELFLTRKEVVAPDKKAIAEILKDGNEIAGAKLVYNNSLRIG